MCTYIIFYMCTYLLKWLHQNCLPTFLVLTFSRSSPASSEFATKRGECFTQGIQRWGLKGVRKCCSCAEKLQIRKLPRKQTGQTNNGETQENTASNEKCRWQKAWFRGLACSGGLYMPDITSFLENPGSSMRHRTCACSLSNISFPDVH